MSPHLAPERHSQHISNQSSSPNSPEQRAGSVERGRRRTTTEDAEREAMTSLGISEQECHRACKAYLRKHCFLQILLLGSLILFFGMMNVAVTIRHNGTSTLHFPELGTEKSIEILQQGLHFLLHEAALPQKDILSLGEATTKQPDAGGEMAGTTPRVEAVGG